MRVGVAGGRRRNEERWRAYHGGDNLDASAELFFYCPACTEREFGAD
jgi:hypothetical protein